MRELLDAAAHARGYYARVACPSRPVDATLGWDPLATRRALTPASPTSPSISARCSTRSSPTPVRDHRPWARPASSASSSAGALPAAHGRRLARHAWDQNACLASPTPSVAAIEELTGAWLIDLLDLPRDASFAFVTGCQIAHVTALAAARHRVLADAGWDVERDGLVGAPPVRVIAGEERHVTLDRALRFLGLGTAASSRSPVDQHGAMRRRGARRPRWPPATDRRSCARRPATSTPALSIRSTRSATRRSTPAPGSTSTAPSGFGRAPAPRHRSLLRGCERADSWATDGAQVAERPVRLRHRHRRRRGSAPAAR